MCELFGLSANREVFVSFTWRGFLERGKYNYHGWGNYWFGQGAQACARESRSQVVGRWD